jgi:hypothetical protein
MHTKQSEIQYFSGENTKTYEVSYIVVMKSRTVLTAHEIVDDWIHGAVCIAQPMGQQRDSHHGVWSRNVHGISV